MVLILGALLSFAFPERPPHTHARSVRCNDAVEVVDSDALAVPLPFGSGISRGTGRVGLR